MQFLSTARSLLSVPDSSLSDLSLGNLNLLLGGHSFLAHINLTLETLLGGVLLLAHCLPTHSLAFDPIHLVASLVGGHLIGANLVLGNLVTWLSSQLSAILGDDRRLFGSFAPHAHI